MYAAALAEDPNAFEYDALYDSMQEQKVVPKQQERLARRPKYIASLLEQAEVRKKEQGITFERMLVRSFRGSVAGVYTPCTCLAQA
jgi:coiled-coil domain-containing protein 55